MSLNYNETTGLRVPSGDDARALVNERWVQQFPDSELTDELSNDSKITSFVATVFILLYSALGALWNGFLRGIGLDRELRVFGFERQLSRRSTAIAYAWGNLGSTVGQGLSVLSSDNGQFEVVESATIQGMSSSALITVSAGGSNVVDYRIFAGVAIIDPAVTFPLADVVTSLLDQINVLPEYEAFDIGLSEGGDGRMLVRTLSGEALPLSPDGQRVTVTDAVAVELQSAAAMAVPTTPLTINRFGAAVGGVDGIINVDQGSIGRQRETDEEALRRHEDEIGSPGRSTRRAIRDQLRRVPGVVEAEVVLNNSDLTSADGIPPHSVEAIVQGGLDEDIAEALSTTVAGGIRSHGTEGPFVVAEPGLNELHSFTRPTPIYLTMTATVTPAAGKVISGVELARAQSAIFELLGPSGEGRLTIGKSFLPYSVCEVVRESIDMVAFVNIIVTRTSDPIGGAPIGNPLINREVPATVRQILIPQLSRISVVSA